jgi:hypothetical protein
MPSGSSAPPLPRPSTPPGVPPPEARKIPSKLSYGVVCSSNINRSMEAHVVLGNAGMLYSNFAVMHVLFVLFFIAVIDR